MRCEPEVDPDWDDCYEMVADDVALLETTNTGGSATINAFQSFVGSLMWVLEAGH